MLKLQWLNCLWLLAPVLLWNALFSAQLKHPAFALDEAVPPWMLIVENGLRMAVMILPLFMPLRWSAVPNRLGIAVYALGLAVYFISWIPLMVAPDSAWSNSLPGFLAPAYTPLLWLVGIGLIGGWWPYLLLAVVFVGVHISHWGQAYVLAMGT